MHVNVVWACSRVFDRQDLPDITSEYGRPYIPARSLRSAELNMLTTILNVMGVVLSRWLDHPYGTPCQVLLGPLYFFTCFQVQSKNSPFREAFVALMKKTCIYCFTVLNYNLCIIQRHTPIILYATAPLYNNKHNI